MGCSLKRALSRVTWLNAASLPWQLNCKYGRGSSRKQTKKLFLNRLTVETREPVAPAETAASIILLIGTRYVH